MKPIEMGCSSFRLCSCPFLSVRVGQFRYLVVLGMAREARLPANKDAVSRTQAPPVTGPVCPASDSLALSPAPQNPSFVRQNVETRRKLYVVMLPGGGRIAVASRHPSRPQATRATLDVSSDEVWCGACCESRRIWKNLMRTGSRARCRWIQWWTLRGSSSMKRAQLAGVLAG